MLLLALLPVGWGLPALASLALVAATLAALVGYEVLASAGLAITHATRKRSETSTAVERPRTSSHQVVGCGSAGERTPRTWAQRRFGRRQV
ncbi:MAG: hypothetical protein H0U77_04355 [Nocardioidaceae bacterium]|nr:hypothetical protein [Nocardioidaceae bacterium]